jgi:hypothetical protein
MSPVAKIARGEHFSMVYSGSLSNLDPKLGMQSLGMTIGAKNIIGFREKTEAQFGLNW